MKVLIHEDSHYYKAGQIIELSECTAISDRLLKHNNNDITKFSIIKEELTPEDIVTIERIIQKKLTKMFWMLYTRSNFILK